MFIKVIKSYDGHLMIINTDLIAKIELQMTNPPTYCVSLSGREERITEESGKEVLRRLGLSF